MFRRKNSAEKSDSPATKRGCMSHVARPGCLWLFIGVVVLTIFGAVTDSPGSATSASASIVSASIASASTATVQPTTTPTATATNAATNTPTLTTTNEPTSTPRPGLFSFFSADSRATRQAERALTGTPRAATRQAERTAAAETRAVERATQDAARTATREVRNATGTASAATQVAERATRDAVRTATAEAKGTERAISAETRTAERTATSEAEATADTIAEATSDAEWTAIAEGMETTEAELDAVATEVFATADAERVADAATRAARPTRTPRPTRIPTATEQLAWYEGGTLHNATLGEWRNASERNRLATAADWFVSGFDVNEWSEETEASVHIGATYLVNCLRVEVIDELIEDLGADRPIQESAVLCLLLLKADLEEQVGE